MISSCLERPQLSGAPEPVCGVVRIQGMLGICWNVCWTSRTCTDAQGLGGRGSTCPKINGVIRGDQSTASFPSRGNAPERKRQGETPSISSQVSFLLIYQAQPSFQEVGPTAKESHSYLVVAPGGVSGH